MDWSCSTAQPNSPPPPPSHDSHRSRPHTTTQVVNVISLQFRRLAWWTDRTVVGVRNGERERGEGRGWGEDKHITSCTEISNSLNFFSLPFCLPPLSTSSRVIFSMLSREPRNTKGIIATVSPPLPSLPLSPSSSSSPPLSPPPSPPLQRRDKESRSIE